MTAGGSDADPRGGGADRSSAPPPPADVLTVVPASALPGLERYAGLLARAGTVRGLLGPREVPRLWSRHLLNCALVAPLVPADATVVDVGTGAGLPGLVLSLVRPDLRLVLLDSTARRTTFVAEAVTALGLTDRVQVVTGRAEDPRVRGQVGGADVVVSRAVAGFPQLLGWCLPLLGPGGTMLAMKGAGARDEIAAARGEFRRAGAVVVGVHELAYDGQATTVVAVRRRADVSRGTQGEA